jgi:MFS family permease
METHPGKDRAITALAATIFTTNLGGGAILPIIALYTAHLGLSVQLGGVAIALFAVTRCLAPPLAGHFIDRLDPHPFMVWGIVLFILASALQALPVTGILLAGRAFQGLGVGVVTVACYTLIARRYTLIAQLRMANARFMVLEMIGAVLGPVVGAEVFRITGSFSGPFIASALFGAGALALYLLRQNDIGGREPVPAPPDTETERALFAPSGLGILILVSAINFILMFIWGSMQFIMPFFALSRGIDVHAVGYFFGALALGQILTMWLAQRELLNRLPMTAMMLTGSLVSLAALTVLVRSSGFWAWLVLFGATGAGVGLVFPALPSLAAGTIVGKPGRGVGYLEMGGWAGFILGPVVISFLAAGENYARAFHFELVAAYLSPILAIVLSLVRRRAARV